MTRAPASGLRIGTMSPADRTRVGEILRGTEQFREKEIAVALELFDAAFGIGELPRDPDYRFVGAYDPDGDLVGYACFGPTSGADRAYDLYWIAVARDVHGRGVGSALLAEVESRLLDAGARLVLIETSSRTDFAATREFYSARGYTEQARIRDFYAPEDDRVMLTKTLHPLSDSPGASPR
jgi:ribosomal protein S18 acetylase RimI-like enzyme